MLRNNINSKFGCTILLFNKLISLINIDISNSMVTQLERAIRQAKTNMKNKILQEHSNMINRATEQNLSNRIPHGFVKQLVADVAPVCPWLTYNTMMNFHRKQARLGSITDIPVALRDTTNEYITASTERKKGGRPLGSTDKRKETMILLLLQQLMRLRLHLQMKKSSQINQTSA